jgi:hypothetical protein
VIAGPSPAFGLGTTTILPKTSPESSRSTPVYGSASFVPRKEICDWVCVPGTEPLAETSETPSI